MDGSCFRMPRTACAFLMRPLDSFRLYAKLGLYGFFLGADKGGRSAFHLRYECFSIRLINYCLRSPRLSNKDSKFSTVSGLAFDRALQTFFITASATMISFMIRCHLDLQRYSCRLPTRAIRSQFCNIVHRFACVLLMLRPGIIRKVVEEWNPPRPPHQYPLLATSSFA
jgi:hypothetical protein